MNESYITDLVSRLVAGLVAGDSSTSDMGANIIYPDDLRDLKGLNMPFEAKVLESVIDLERAGIEVSPFTVRSHLASQDLDTYAGQIEELVEKKGAYSEAGQIAFIIRNIHMAHRDNMRLQQRASAILSANDGTPAERLIEVMEMFVEAGTRLNDRNEPMLNQFDLMSRFKDDVRKAYQHREDNPDESPHPNWPFPKLNELVPHMRIGNLYALMGKTGYGKTVTGATFAEWWAWKKPGQKFDVYVLLMETTAKQYFNGQVARNCNIPTKASEAGLWSPDVDSEASRRVKTFEQNYIENKGLGILHYQESAGWNTAKIEGFIDACIKNTEELNKLREDVDVPACKPVFAIDYYSLIDTTQWNNTNVPLNFLAQWLKQMVARKKLYMFTLVQEQEGVNDSEHVYPKGGNEIKKQAQVFMRLSRSIATQDLLFLHNGQPLLNALGQPRYLHKKDQYHSVMYLQVLKANDDETGSVKLSSEMSLLKIASS